MSVFLETGTGDVGPENRRRVWFAAFTAFVSFFAIVWVFGCSFFLVVQAINAQQEAKVIPAEFSNSDELTVARVSLMVGIACGLFALASVFSLVMSIRQRVRLSWLTLGICMVLFVSLSAIGSFWLMNGLEAPIISV